MSMLLNIWLAVDLRISSKNLSVGLSSGEYGGRKIQVRFSLSCMIFGRCDGALSKTMTIYFPLNFFSSSSKNMLTMALEFSSKPMRWKLSPVIGEIAENKYRLENTC